MDAPPNFEERQSTYRPPRFNSQYYGWWKTRMHDFIMAKDSELWDIICDGPHVPMKKFGQTRPMVPKNKKEYNDIDRKVVEKNYRTKKILVCGIGPDEYNRISACDSVKEIWETLQTTHEGTTQVKQSKIDMLTAENKLVRKILSVLPGSWESKVNVITEAKDLQTLTMDELIGNLKTYEMKKKKTLKGESQIRKRTWFQKMVRRNDGLPKRGSSSKARNNDLYHKCGKSGHFIKDCPLLKQEQYKQNLDKAAKRNSVPDKRFSRKSATDNVVKQALAAWGDSSGESEGEPDAENSSIVAVETKAMKYDSLFALMAPSDDDEEDENNEVNFRDVQRNLKSYSSKKLRSLENVLIDAYYSLINDKEILTIELGDAEQSRDDLVVCVVDLNETIANFEKENEALNEKINSVENERDDLMVVVVDLKETIEGFSNEKHTLEEKIAATEYERDDFLVIITDLEETTEGLKSELRPASIEKGKKVALQAELKKVKTDLEKSLKWTWSSDVVNAMYFNNSGNRQGIGFQKEKTPYNPHSKYVTVLDNWLCTHCVNKGHFKENCQARVQSVQKNKLFTEKVTTKEGPGNSERKQTIMVHGQWMLKSHDWKHHGFSLTESPTGKGMYPLEIKKVNRCMIRSLLNKTPYEFLNRRKPKITHLRTFGCKRYDLNNGKDELVKFDAQSDKGILLRYSSQRKVYKVCNKRTQCMEKSSHELFNKTPSSNKGGNNDDQDIEPLLVPGEISNVSNGKADMMSQNKETR
ncbi:intracellular protein transport protein USO1-like [Nicotiana sylvestris]|uniref:intracellular protein transport protein USO1-like n=1 Tax=Nicotiana sylvestris TaxID=4096 RepID=UPI00388C96C1